MPGQIRIKKGKESLLVPIESLSSFFADGYQPDPNTPVNIVLGEGKLKEVKFKDVQRWLGQDPNYKIAPSSAWANAYDFQREKESVEGIGHGVKAVAEGAAATASAGVSDVILDKLGADTKKRKRHRGGLRTTGEVLGFVPALANPGSMAGRAFGKTVPGKLMRIGTSAERTYERALAARGLNKGVAGLAARSAGQGAVAAAEAGVYGAIQGGSAELLSGDPVSFDTLSSAMLNGAGDYAKAGFAAGAAGGAAVTMLGGVGKRWHKMAAKDKQRHIDAQTLLVAGDEARTAIVHVPEITSELHSMVSTAKILGEQLGKGRLRRLNKLEKEIEALAGWGGKKGGVEITEQTLNKLNKSGKINVLRDKLNLLEREVDDILTQTTGKVLLQISKTAPDNLTDLHALVLRQTDGIVTPAGVKAGMSLKGTASDIIWRRYLTPATKTGSRNLKAGRGLKWHVGSGAVQGFSYGMMRAVRQLPWVGPVAGGIAARLAGVLGRKALGLGKPAGAQGLRALAKSNPKYQFRGAVGGKMSKAAAKWSPSGAMAATVLLMGDPEQKAKIKGKSFEEMFPVYYDAIEQSVQNPLAAQSNLVKSFHAAGINDSYALDRMTASAMRQLQYIYGQLPKSRKSDGSYWPPSPTKLNKLVKVMQLFSDPLSIMEAIAEGSASDELIAAMYEVFPDLYAAMEREMMIQLPNEHGIKAERLKAAFFQNPRFERNLVGAQNIFGPQNKQQPSPVREQIKSQEQMTQAQRIQQ